MSKLITLPGGKKIWVPTILDMDNADSTAVVSYSPDWIVAFFSESKKAITKGNLKIKGMEECIELQGWFSEIGHHVSGDLAGSLVSSGSVQQSELILVLPVGEYGPKIENQLYNGKLFDHIMIFRLAWIEGKATPLQQLRFDQVRIIDFQMNIQYLVVSAQSATRQNKIMKYGQDGKSKGQNISEMDYRSGKNPIK